MFGSTILMITALVGVPLYGITLYADIHCTDSQHRFGFVILMIAAFMGVPLMGNIAYVDIDCTGLHRLPAQVWFCNVNDNGTHVFATFWEISPMQTFIELAYTLPA